MPIRDTEEHSMRKSKQFPNAIKKYYHPENKSCPYCQGKTKADHLVSRRYVVRFDGVIHAHNVGRRCIDDACHEAHGRTYFHSAQGDALGVKRFTYGMDILVYIGLERTNHHRNFKEIMQDLQAKSIAISERNVEYLFGVYTVLLKCSLPERLEQLRPKIEKNKGILLSIDGLQPEKGNDMLFVIRDTLLGEVLHAELVSSSNTETMVRLLEVIQKKKIPVLGIVSDAQRSIRKAVSLVFPEVPYQLCQFHYLKDLAKPAADEDRALKTDIKKELRGIRNIEQTLQERTDSDAQTLLGFTEAIRAVLGENGEPPLDGGGTQVYEQISAIHDSLTACEEKKRP